MLAGVSHQGDEEPRRRGHVPELLGAFEGKLPVRADASLGLERPAAAGKKVGVAPRGSRAPSMKPREAVQMAVTVRRSPGLDPVGTLSPNSARRLSHARRLPALSGGDANQTGHHCSFLNRAQHHPSARNTFRRPRNAFRRNALSELLRNEPAGASPATSGHCRPAPAAMPYCDQTRARRASFAQRGTPGDVPLPGGPQ